MYCSLKAVRDKYGGWKIERHDGSGWTATRRQGTQIRVIGAHDLKELDEKLTARG